VVQTIVMILTIESLNAGFTCNKMTSTCDGVTVTNQIENYMDYSPDVCMSVLPMIKRYGLK
jgi:hypothetical protein